MEQFTIGAEKEDVGIRLDAFIAENLEELSRSAIQKLIVQNQVLIDGQSEKTVKANYRIKGGEIITICLPEPQAIEIAAEDIPLTILYEDKDLIVINKPQGMVVHPAPGHYTGTVVNALLYHCGEELSGINGYLRPGIVHRIDKDTSGIIVAAKSDAAHKGLALQLAEHTITRKYNAIVFNKVKELEGTVDTLIDRNPNDRKKMAVVHRGGRKAVTHYKVLEYLGKYTYIEAQLETGRTHQIRVHMTYLGNPLVGDTVYGPKKQPFSLKGQALHARVLGFVHPVTGEYMEFETELPEYFQKLLRSMGAVSSMTQAQ